jgi:hypothetical protein
MQLIFIIKQNKNMAIKTCKNGHKYDDTLFNECPICPSKDITGSKTQAISYDDANKTKIIGGDDRTVAVGTKDSTYISYGSASGLQTKIAGIGAESVNDRKLVGFLVTYDIHPLGTAFRLYEGKNFLGSGSGCDIYIENDSLVSGKHMTILYRNKVFLFKDEFSTNGTFVNGSMENEGELHANDLIMVGHTRFIFLQVPFETIDL